MTAAADDGEAGAFATPEALERPAVMGREREPVAVGARSPAPRGGDWRDYASAPLRPVAAGGGQTPSAARRGERPRDPDARPDSRDPTERK